MKHRWTTTAVAFAQIFYILFNLKENFVSVLGDAEVETDSQVPSKSFANGHQQQSPPTVSMRGNTPKYVLEKLYEDLFPDDNNARTQSRPYTANSRQQHNSDGPAYFSPTASAVAHHSHSLMLGGGGMMDGMMLLRNYEDAAIAYLQQLKQCRNDVCGQLPLIVPGLSAENDLFCGSDGYLHTRCTQSCMNSKVHLARRFTRNRHYKYQQNPRHPHFLPALQNHSYVVLQEMVLPSSVQSNTALLKQQHHHQHSTLNDSALSVMAQASALAAHKLPLPTKHAQRPAAGGAGGVPTVSNSFQQLCPPAHEPRFDRLFGRWRNHCNKICAGQFLEDDLVVGWTGAEHIVFGCQRALSCFNKRALALLGVGTFANLLQRSYDSVYTEKATIEAVEFYPYLGVDCYRKLNSVFVQIPLLHTICYYLSVCDDSKCLNGGGGGTSARRRRAATVPQQQSATASAIELDAVLMSSNAPSNEDTYCGSDGLLYHDLCAVGCKNAALYNIKSSLAHVVIASDDTSTRHQQQSSSYSKASSSSSPSIVPIALRDANFVLAHPYKADEGCFGEPYTGYPWKDVQAEFDLWKHNSQALCKDFPGSTICGVNQFDSMMFPCEAAMTDFNKNIERQLQFSNYNHHHIRQHGNSGGAASSPAMSLLSSLPGLGAGTVFRANSTNTTGGGGDKFDYFPIVRACDITDAFLMSYMIAHKALTQQHS